MAKLPPLPDEFTRREVKMLALAGQTDDRIAQLMHCGETFLKEHYAQELTEAREHANANIARKLYETALSGNVAAMIFWCKTRLRWKEVHAVEHSGSDGGPLTATVNIVLEAPKPAITSKTD